MFSGTKFPQMIRNLQDYDKNNSFTRGSFPYNFENEPRSRSGVNQGLFLIIDGHTDLRAAGSNGYFTNSFGAFIGPSGTFPQMGQGFDIRPGECNKGVLTQAFCANQKSISPTFYDQLFCEQIPKVQKYTDDLTVFLHFWDLQA